MSVPATGKCEVVLRGERMEEGKEFKYFWESAVQAWKDGNINKR